MIVPHDDIHTVGDLGADHMRTDVSGPPVTNHVMARASWDTATVRLMTPAASRSRGSQDAELIDWAAAWRRRSQVTNTVSSNERSSAAVRCRASRLRRSSSRVSRGACSTRCWSTSTTPKDGHSYRTACVAVPAVRPTARTVSTKPIRQMYQPSVACISVRTRSLPGSAT